MLSLCRQTVIVKRLLDGYSKQDPPDLGTSELAVLLHAGGDTTQLTKTSETL